MSASPGELERSLAAALALDVPYTERGPRVGGTEAAVLLVFGFARGSAEPSLLLTRRTETMERHKGQMAFPGGVRDPGDADPVATALRESREEVGIPPERVRVVGRLPELRTVTGYSIAPIVGLLDRDLEDVPLEPSEGEIAEAFWVSLGVLRDPATYSRELLRVGPVDYPIHVYRVNGHRVWGATGAMIKNLLDRLAALR
jgi:8-oxo-dGTP pyrophosphatase MutT (NUDIX family)